MNADLQRIGWLRSSLVVAACALLAFVAWSASGASLSSTPNARVSVHAVAVPRTNTPTPATRPLGERRTAAVSPAHQAPLRARTHECKGVDGKPHRVDERIKCLTFKAPSGRLLDRLRQHKALVTPAKPPAAVPPPPGTGQTQTGATGAPQSQSPTGTAPTTSKTTPKSAGTGGATASP
jgi:hypothetical protein